MVDLHNHVLPAVDDGARDVEQAVAAVRALAAEGVTAAVATPHFRASALEQPDGAEGRLWRIGESLSSLEAALAGASVELPIERGTEVLLDAPAPDLADPRIRMAGTRFVLVEFAGLRIPAYGGNQLAALVEAGWVPVLAHVERYAGLEHRMDRLPAWKEAGARFQVNCTSLHGAYGARAEQAAWALLEDGLADYLASDFHCRGEPGIAAAVSILAETPGGDEVAELLTATNPQRLLAGEDPLPVPSLALRRERGPRFWRWLKSRGGRP